MVTNKRLKFWARQIEIAHIIVSILVIASVIAVFVSEKFKVIPALFIIFVFLVQQIYGLCPLTRLENILLRLSGVDVKKRNFMPRFYKKYFHIKFNNKSFLQCIKYIPVIWKRFFNTCLIFNCHALDQKARNGKCHGDSVIIKCLYYCSFWISTCDF